MCHILVGTPKDLVSRKINRTFSIEKITMIVMDDADIVNTTQLVKQNVTKLVPNARKILLSAVSLDSAMHYIANCNTMVSHRDSMNVSQFSIKCPTIAEKFDAIVNIFQILRMTNDAQAIVFVNVNTIF